jgi:hypothetical protein
MLPFSVNQQFRARLLRKSCAIRLFRPSVFRLSIEDPGHVGTTDFLFCPIVFVFIFLRTLLHGANLNPFVFKRFRTLCPKTPGVGVGALLPFFISATDRPL